MNITPQEFVEAVRTGLKLAKFSKETTVYVGHDEKGDLCACIVGLAYLGYYEKCPWDGSEQAVGEFELKARAMLNAYSKKYGEMLIDSNDKGVPLDTMLQRIKMLQRFCYVCQRMRNPDRGEYIRAAHGVVRWRCGICKINRQKGKKK